MSKPKLLLDENIGGIVISSLRETGYDVVSVLETFPGAEDEEVLKKATKENRILVTLDKDFGKLIYLYSQKHVGVIFLRPTRETPENIYSLLLGVLTRYLDEIKGKFITASEGRIRIK